MLVHKSASVLIASIILAAGCTTSPRQAPQPSHYPPNGTYAPCKGPDVLEVSNPARVPVDVYAQLGQNELPVFIATITGGRGDVALDGTPAGRRGAYFFARLDGKDVPNATLRRRCDD